MRPRHEQEHGHLPGAALIPHDELEPPDPVLTTIQSITWLIAAAVGYLSGPRLPELSYLARALPAMKPTDRAALLALTYAHAAETAPITEAAGATDAAAATDNIVPDGPASEAPAP